MILRSSSFAWMGASFIGIALLAAGCGPTAHVEKDKSADFSHYKTYGWAEQGETKNGKTNHRNDISEKNIRFAVDAELQKKGFVQSATNPDLLISTDLLVEKNQQRNKEAVYSQPQTRSYYNTRTGRYNTYYYPSQFRGYETYSKTVKEGTVTITMLDASTDKAVWQGWVTSELDRGNITSDEIDRSVKAIFKKFDGK